MIKNSWKFIRTYKWLVLAGVGALVALSLDVTQYHTAAHWIIISVAVIELMPLIRDMYDDFRHGKYGVDILAAVTIVVSMVLGQYWAGMVIILMITGGKSLEDYAGHRATRELSALLKRAPQKARVVHGSEEIEVQASEVRAGDKIIIRPGEVVPVDARIVSGDASFDESSLTGESLPQVKKAGQDILSGSINIDGVVTAQALRPAVESQYEQIVQLVQAASKSQAPFVRLADKYSIPFTVLAFGVAAIAWVLSGQTIRFLEVLVVATPCPLIIAAPIAIISGMGRSARHGIIIKSGTALEKLATANTFAFDKTGTLTQGKLEVDTIKSFGGHTSTEVMRFAASLEQNSDHVLANAILQKAAALKIQVPKAKHIQEIAGHGISGTISAKRVIVGRLGMLQATDVAIPKQLTKQKLQSTAAFVAVDNKLAGLITFKDELRDDAETTVRQLLDNGVKQVVMVSGDSQHATGAIAKRLRIKQFFAEALPGDKILAIEKLPERPVAFVGDGVNDAPVLIASDIGIAMGVRGSTAASESADAVIMKDDLMHVAQARRIARDSFKIAQQSILVGIGLSILLMIVFATGRFLPIYGAILQECVDILVILNALRAHGSFKHPG